MMKIVTDENIPCAREAFSSLGEVVALPGRRLTARDVANVDILLVRSVTRVTESLLHGSSVRFVGTATIGVDHIDLEYLKRSQIGFANAPGSNAVSAAEYLISALLVMAERRAFSLAKQTVGIIGCGNVGGRVLARLEALGCSCLVNDPPRQETLGDRDYVSLDDALAADIVTLHVPLRAGGPHPTHHLLDEDRFARLRPGALFANTARGSVVDEPGLKRVLERRRDLSLVLDVWEGEPGIDVELLRRTEIGTPHIAGYSLDGKLRGTEMIYQAACTHFGVEPIWSVRHQLAPPALNRLCFSATASDEQVIKAAVLAAYDVRRDDSALRRIVGLPAAARAREFDRLRKEYPVRREFASIQVEIQGQRVALAQRLRSLGFQVHTEGSETVVSS